MWTVGFRFCDVIAVDQPLVYLSSCTACVHGGVSIRECCSIVVSQTERCTVLSRLRIMRDLANKMAELKFVAPLAQFDDEWSGSTDSFQQYNNNNNNNNDVTTTTLTGDNKLDDERSRLDTDLLVLSDIVKEAATVSKGTAGQLIVTGSTTAVAAADNFTETISGSLEDLVNTFDEKITKCFGNFEQSVEELAPVQLRSQEEIMSECQ